MQRGVELKQILNYVALSQYSLQWVVRDVWRVLFTTIGIALGVSVFVATLVAHRSVQGSFTKTVEAFGGGGWWEVYSNSPDFSEDVVLEFKQLSPPITVVPLIQHQRTVECYTQPANAPEKSEYRRINLVGIDTLSLPYLYKRGDGLAYASGELVEFISNPEKVALDARLNNCTRIVLDGRGIATAGSTLLDIDSSLEAVPLVLQDISWVQDRTDRMGMISRIYLRPSDEGISGAMVAIAKQRGLFIQRVADRGARFSKITEAFRINLLFLSTSSLLVASYLIHSLLTFWCLKRRDDVTVLRSIGVNSETIRGLILAEVCLLGIIGGALGILMGISMSRVMESIVSETISTLYQRVRVGELAVEWWVIPFVTLLVLVVSLFGGVGPASQLSKTPIAVLKGSGGAAPRVLHLGRRFVFGVGLIIASVLFSLLIRSSSTLWLGLGAPLLFLVGAITLVPPILRIVLDVLLRFRDCLPVAFQLSIDHLSLTFSRSSGAVTALMISAGLFIAIDLMVASFSGSLKSWLQEVLKADVYLSIDERSKGSISGVSSEMANHLKSVPGVEYVDTARTVVAEYNGRPFQATGVSFDILRTQARLYLLHPKIEADRADIPHVFVSEPFARWQRVRAGDTLTLFSESQKLFVEGVYRDYSTENGVVLMEDTLFTELFRGVPIRSVSLYLRPGADVGKVIADVRALPWEGELSVRSEEGLRTEIFRIFNATFRVTEILMWLTLVVALWVVSNTITIMIAERSSELQTLRSIGANRERLVGMVSLEAALLGLFGIAGSIACGSGLALILVYIVNPFFFGWTLSPHWSWRIFLILLGGVPVLTGIVGALVAFVIFRQPIQGIKYE